MKGILLIIIIALFSAFAYNKWIAPKIAAGGFGFSVD